MAADLTKIQQFLQSTIDDIAGNLASMKDSKGRNRYASGKTAQKVGEDPPLFEVDETKDGLILKVYMPYYYDYIDKGVNGLMRNLGSKYSFRKLSPPPLKAMREFMINRGIVPRDANGKRTPKGKNYEKQLNSLAYAIGVNLKKQGFYGVPYYSSVINEEWYQELGKVMVGVYGKEIIDTWNVLFVKPKM